LRRRSLMVASSLALIFVSASSRYPCRRAGSQAGSQASRQAVRPAVRKVVGFNESCNQLRLAVPCTATAADGREMLCMMPTRLTVDKA
jgi:hypothetical protein